MSKKTKSVFIALCMSFITFILYRILFSTGGISVEDYLMNHILKGDWGEASSQINYSNLVLGAILSRVYYFIPEIEWWYAIQIFLNIYSLVILVFFILERIQGWYGILCGELISLVLGYYTVYTIDYQKTASILCITGSLLLLLTQVVEKNKKFWNIIGGGLLFTGTLYYFHIIYVVIFCTIVIIVNTVIQSRNTENIHTLSYKYKGIMIILGISIFCGVGSELIYNKDEQWTMWKETFDTYQELKLKGIPQWYEYQNEYTELGFSENDVKILEKGILDDEKIFNIETLEQIKNLHQTPYNQYDFLEIFLYTLFRNLIGILVLLLLVIELWWGKDGGGVIVCTLFAYILGFVYINYQYGSTNIEDTGFLIYSGMIINFLYLLLSFRIETREIPLRQASIIAITIVFFIFNKNTGLVNSYKNEEESLSIRNEIGAFQKDKNNLYILDGNSFQDLYLFYGLKDSGNIFFVGNNILPLPTQQKTFEGFGGRNITELFLNNTDTYFVTEDLEIIETVRYYLEYHYGNYVESVIEQDKNLYKVKYVSIY